MKIIRKYWVFLLAVLFALFVAGIDYAFPMYVVDNPNGVGLASDRLKKAMQKMGPRYHYRIWPSGRLEVKLNGKWQRLRY